jgi:hypothetical protein
VVLNSATSAGENSAVNTSVAFCCRPAAWSNTTRSAGVSDPVASATASIVSCSARSSCASTVWMSASPWVAAVLFVRLVASDWNTCGASVMSFV